DGLAAFVNVNLAGIPLLFILVIAVSVVMHFVLQRSRYGRYIHAIGQNHRATVGAGRNVRHGPVTPPRAVVVVLSDVSLGTLPTSMVLSFSPSLRARRVPPSTPMRKSFFLRGT
ncbi:MAG: Inner-membrane translocator, partial [Parcubacteria group bacterium GW2011_GWF2_44_7]